VWLPALFDAYSTICAGQDKAFTAPTHQASVFRWQTDSSRHGYSSSYVHVALRQSRIARESVLCQAEKRVNALKCYVLGGIVQLGTHLRLTESMHLTKLAFPPALIVSENIEKLTLVYADIC